MIGIVLAAYVGTTVWAVRRYSGLGDAPRLRVEVHDGWFYRGGEKFLVKAVGYDPARPGELPWAVDSARGLLEDDLERIRAAGFNTIRTWESLSRDELAMAERQDLMVLQGIWVDPAGDFGDPTFRGEARTKVRELVTASQGSRAILAYLVMNEPEPAHVRAVGVDETRALLREVAAVVREVDPGVPVAFSSWPGLEFLSEPSLDLVAANLYPFRPQVLVDAIGYAGLVRIWKELAQDRPLLVTELGVSVAPNLPGPDEPGGATEEEQAQALPELCDAALRSGAAGSTVFMWIDGWWKNLDESGDELTHDRDDGEEWFGLNAMDDLQDTRGRPRPALAAMETFNQAVLTLPVDGAVVAREVEVEVHIEPLSLEVGSPCFFEVSIEGGPAMNVPAVREGPWLRGRTGLLARVSGPQRLSIDTICGGQTLARATRTVLPPGQEPLLGLEVSRQGAGWRAEATVTDSAGAPLAGVEVGMAATSADRDYDKSSRALTDAEGRVVLEGELPHGPASALVAAAVLAPGEASPLALQWTLLESRGSR